MYITTGIGGRRDPPRSTTTKLQKEPDTITINRPVSLIKILAERATQ